MSEIELKLKEENEMIKDIFNFNVCETQVKHIKASITESNNGPHYQILLLDHYSKCRPRHQHICRELVECVYSCFPEQINEIQKDIKNKIILRFIIFPKEFPINESKEQQQMFSLLQRDDIDGFISFLSNNPTIDNRTQELEDDEYYLILFDFFFYFTH